MGRITQMKISALIPTKSACLLRNRSRGLTYKSYYVCWECAWRNDKAECDRLRAEA